MRSFLKLVGNQAHQRYKAANLFQRDYIFSQNAMSWQKYLQAQTLKTKHIKRNLMQFKSLNHTTNESLPPAPVGTFLENLD